MFAEDRTGNSMCSTYLSGLVWRNAALTFVEILFSKVGQALLFYFMALRYGPGLFGIVTFAFTLVYLASVVVTFGSYTYGTKLIASGEGKNVTFLSSLLSFCLFNATVAFVVLSAGALVIFGTSLESLFVVIWSASLIPEGISGVVRVSFYGREIFLPVVILNIVISLATLACGLLALNGGASLLEMGILFLTACWITALAALRLHSRFFESIGLKLDTGAYVRLGQASLPYLLITILAAIHMKADVPMIRVMAGRLALGLYGVAATVVNCACLLIQALVCSLFPAVARSGGAREHLSPPLAQRTLFVPFAMGLAVAVAISLSAKLAVSTFLGEAYEGSTQPLIILSWFLPFIFVSTVALRMMMACGKTAVVIRILTVNCVVNIGANCILIPVAGINGAAVSTVISAATSMVQCVLSLRRWHITVPVTGDASAETASEILSEL